MILWFSCEFPISPCLVLLLFYIHVFFHLHHQTPHWYVCLTLISPLQYLLYNCHSMWDRSLNTTYDWLCTCSLSVCLYIFKVKPDTHQPVSPNFEFDFFRFKSPSTMHPKKPTKDEAADETRVWWDITRCLVSKDVDARRVSPCIRGALNNLGYTGPSLP